MVFNYSATIEESVDKIFSAILVGNIRKDNTDIKDKLNMAKICLSRFVGNFPTNIFFNEYAIFHNMIVDLNIKTFSADMLYEIISNNRDIVLNSPLVDLSKYSKTSDGRYITDDEKLYAFIEDIRDKMVELSNNIVTEEEFNSNCIFYTEWFKNQYMLETAQNMTLIMSDEGYMEKKRGNRSRYYKGYEDSRIYYNERIAVIRELSDMNSTREKVLDEEWYEKDSAEEERDDAEKLFDVGLVEIDEKVGTLRRGHMVCLLGPTKGGKTRFANYLVQRALENNLNVAVWILEGSDSEWEANQIAAHIMSVEGLSISSKYILEKKYLKNEKVAKMVAAAKFAIAVNEKRGRLSFIDGTAYVEDFLDVLDSHYDNKNPFDVLVVDSPLNIMSRRGRTKVDRVSDAFMMLKSHIKSGMKKSPLAIVTAQLKQTVIDNLRKNPDDTIDITAGGESAESIRTPDEVIGLFSSKEEREAGMMNFYSVASRHGGNFQDFTARCDLGCCYFYSDSSLNE